MAIGSFIKPGLWSDLTFLLQYTQRLSKYFKLAVVNITFNDHKHSASKLLKLAGYISEYQH